jgi:GNAT superfamily N-acetyltransferase
MDEAALVTVRRLTSDLLDDYLEFFDGRAFTDNANWDGCYCWFPHHDPDDGEWTQRSGAQNRAAVADAIIRGHMQGYLAYAQGRVVGWCSAAPRDRYPTLDELPGDGARIGATPCFIVEPGWRGRGIGRRLLEAAIEGLTADGMERLQAGPIRHAVTPADRHRGTVEAFEANGYERISDLPDGTSLMEKRLG